MSVSMCMCGTGLFRDLCEACHRKCKDRLLRNLLQALMLVNQSTEPSHHIMQNPAGVTYGAMKRKFPQLVCF